MVLENQDVKVEIWSGGECFPCKEGVLVLFGCLVIVLLQYNSAQKIILQPWCSQMVLALVSVHNSETWSEGAAVEET